MSSFFFYSILFLCLILRTILAYCTCRGEGRSQALKVAAVQGGHFHSSSSNVTSRSVKLLAKFFDSERILFEENSVNFRMGCGPSRKQGFVFNNIPNDVLFSMEYESTENPGTLVGYKDVIIPYKHKVRFTFIVGQERIYTFKIPELGYEYALKAKLTTLNCVTANFFGFRDLGKGVSDVVIYDNYKDICAHLTKLVINHIEILSIPEFVETLQVVKTPEVNSTAGSGRWRYIHEPLVRTKNSTSDKLGKSLEITSLLCNIATQFDPTGISGHVQTAVDTSVELNKAYRAVSGKGDNPAKITGGSNDDGKFCTSCGTKSVKDANFCGKCGKSMTTNSVTEF